MQSFHLHLPDQFLAACAHYELDPQDVLQQFLNSANFPGVREPKGDLHFAASLFLMEYLAANVSSPSRYTPCQRAFLDNMAFDRRQVLNRIERYSPERKLSAINRHFGRFRKFWSEIERMEAVAVRSINPTQPSYGSGAVSGRSPQSPAIPPIPSIPGYPPNP
jgi:hypothetical protein